MVGVVVVLVLRVFVLWILDCWCLLVGLVFVAVDVVLWLVCLCAWVCIWLNVWRLWWLVLLRVFVWVLSGGFYDVAIYYLTLRLRVCVWVLLVVVLWYPGFVGLVVLLWVLGLVGVILLD